MLYTQEYGLFRQTVRSLLAGGWRGRLVVLDNSAGHDTAGDDLLQSGAVEALRTSGSLKLPAAAERGGEHIAGARPCSTTSPCTRARWCWGQTPTPASVLPLSGVPPEKALYATYAAPSATGFTEHTWPLSVSYGRRWIGCKD